MVEYIVKDMHTTLNMTIARRINLVYILCILYSQKGGGTMKDGCPEFIEVEVPETCKGCEYSVEDEDGLFCRVIFLYPYKQDQVKKYKKKCGFYLSEKRLKKKWKEEAERDDV